MPPLYEGDLLYMPTTFPGISPTKAREILQVTDRLIKSFPEVAEVFGKAGRAETATDPAPMDMIETTIRLKPESEWPAVDIKDDDGKVIAHRKRTPDELTDAMNDVVQIPGLNNAWTMPIRTRIDMLSTGIKTPVGIKIAGPDLATLERIGTEVEAVVRKVPGTTSVFAERVMGGRFIEFEIDREAIARYGLTLADVQDVLSVALGGMPLTTTVEGLQRYTINLRYDRDFRSDLRALREDIVVPTPTGAQIPLGQLATVKVVDGPMGIKSEGAVPNAWVYVDIRGVDVGTYVQMAMRAVNEAVAHGEIKLPRRLQYFLERPIRIHAARQGTADDRRAADAAAHHAHHLPEHEIRHQDRHRDARGAVLAGRRVLGDLFVRLQFERGRLGGHHRARRPRRRNRRGDAALPRPRLCRLEKTRRAHPTGDLRDAIYHGAVKRVRPKAMTACVIIAGLAPILWSHGAGADVMKRIATPMVGGVITSTIMELAVYPAIYFLWRARGLGQGGRTGVFQSSAFGELNFCHFKLVIFRQGKYS